MPGGSSNSTHVSLAMPVYNGARFMPRALECIRSQTHADWTLLISDNASTDATESIGREAAAGDSRILYHRHGENIGAAPNFNFAFKQTSGTLFKWCAHDDEFAPTFLEACVKALGENPKAVLAHTNTNSIDDTGEVRSRDGYESRVPSDRPSERFRAAMEMAYPTIVWGVMRRDAAARTPLIASFVGSDRYFLAELLLGGTLVVVPEYLFSVRFHEGQFAAAFEKNSASDLLRWFDPRAKAGGIGTACRTALHIAGTLARCDAPLFERVRCVTYLTGRISRRVQRRLFGPRPMPTPPSSHMGAQETAS